MSVSCFIIKNTPELREKLEAMGKRPIFNADTKTDKNCLVVMDSMYLASSSPHIYERYCIDCGENEALFLDMAGMRKDTDLGQWFVPIGKDSISYCGRMIKCMDDVFNGHSVYVGRFKMHFPARDFRRATPQEIIDYHNQLK